MGAFRRIKGSFDGINRQRAIRSPNSIRSMGIRTGGIVMNVQNSILSIRLQRWFVKESLFSSLE